MIRYNTIEVGDILYSISSVRMKPSEEGMSNPELMHELLREVNIRIVRKGVEEDGEEVIETTPVYDFPYDTYNREGALHMSSITCHITCRRLSQGSCNMRQFHYSSYIH